MASFADAFGDPLIVDGYWPRKPHLAWLRIMTEPCRRAPRGPLADVGCGNGAYGRALRSAFGFPSLLLVDSSSEVTRRLVTSQAPGEVVIQSDLSDWSAPQNGAAFILLKSVLHHVADRASAIAANARRLGIGGGLAIQSRSREQFCTPTELEFYLPQYPELWLQLAGRYPTLREIHTQMANEGLEVEQLDYVDVFSVPAQSHLRRLSLRQGNSVLLALDEGQHSWLLAEALRRYSSDATLTFSVPMTICIGWRVTPSP